MRDIQRVCVLQDTHSGAETFCSLYIEFSDKLSTQSNYKTNFTSTSI
jgi:hypothetical protein